ncbi:MAG: O-antigen ligase family protein, partial [Chloroflexi bacterium]|nr:O-antigen ligase family protein [Chloroflexota bacterium]
ARALSQFRGLFAYALVPMLVFSLGERGAQRRRTLVALLCVAGALTALRGVLSWAELNDVLRLGGWLHRFASPDEGELVGAVPSASGRFGYLRAWAGNFEGNTLGAFMVLLVPPTAYLALRSGSAVGRLAFGAGAVLVVMALVVSYSRGAYAGAAAASLPALYLLWRRSPWAALAVAAVGAALLFYLVTHLAGAQDRLVTLRTLSDDPTVLHRQLVYEQIAEAVRQNPLWGVGLGTSVRAIGTGADSLYLFVLLRGGLLATGAAAALAWFAGREVVAAFRAGRIRGLDLAIGCGLFGFAVHSLIDYTIWNPKVALAVWLLAGLLLAPALDRRKPGEAAG